MNRHGLLDVLIIRLAALTTRGRRFFRESLDSPSLRELVETTTLEVPEIASEGQYEVVARTAAGDMDPAFHLVRWRGNDYPTLIYHHGNGERPFDYGVFSKNSFKRIVCDARDEVPANLIALRAPLHRSARLYLQRTGRLADFAAMLAVSVRLIEHLQAWSRGRSGGAVVVSGISLGGWVTNLHRAYFNTANAYVPLLAGAALGEVFLTSAYRSLTASLARGRPEQVRAVLNFEHDFATVEEDNVFPLLARHDRIIDFERQKECYGNRPIAVLDTSHTGAALDSTALRRHLLGVLAGAGCASRSGCPPDPRQACGSKV